jgi:hypothetical protein
MGRNQKAMRSTHLASVDRGNNPPWRVLKSSFGSGWR